MWWGSALLPILILLPLLGSLLGQKHHYWVSGLTLETLLGLQAALTLRPFHSPSVKLSSGSSLGKQRSSFVQEPSCNHMQLLGWDLPVNLVFRTLFFLCAGTEPELGVGYLRMQLKAGSLRGRALWTKMF